MKKITYCLALLLLGVLQTFGQTFVGNGTDSSQQLPFDPYYGYSYTQSIYTATEINASGNINSIAWYFNGVSTLSSSKTLKIYLGHTTKTSFTSNSDWQAVSTMTEVFSGEITVNGPGWVSIPLATPFAYNGTDNLVVATAELQPGYNDNNDYFYNYAVSGNRSIVYANDSASPDPASPPNANNVVAYVPNIILGGIAPSCLVPQFLGAHNITDNSVVISWATLGAPTSGGSQYYISESDTNPDSTTLPTNTASGSSVFINSGLLANTHYTVWLRNVCGETPGGWSFPVSFTTACSPIGAFATDFETNTAGTIPECWASILRGPGLSEYASIKVASEQAHSGQNAIKIDNQGSPITSDIILVSPRLSTLAGGTYRLKFFAKSGTENHLQVGTISENSLTGNFSSLSDVDITASYQEYTVNFNSYTGDNAYVAIRLNTQGNSPVYLDDIHWEAIPSCADVTGIAVSSIGVATATVGWNANSNTQWEVAYSATASSPEGLTPIAATQSSLPLSGLSPYSTYKVWVRSICGTDVGAWVGPVFFTTLCTPSATFNENFDSVTLPQLPGCWSSILRGPTLSSYATVATTYTPHSAPYCVYLAGWESTLTNGQNDVILVSPNVVQVADHRIKFFAKGPAKIEVGTLSSAGLDATFIPQETFQLVGSYTEYTVDFTGYTGTDTYIGFRLVEAPSTGWASLDDIRWEESPACADVTGVAIPEYTADTATVTWESGENTKWEVAYGPSTTTDPALLPIQPEVEESTMVLTTLAANTNYKVWVRTVCDEGSYGAWIGPVAFKTNCNATTELNENFDGVTVPAMADCWSTIRRGAEISTDAFVRNSTSKPHSGNNSVRIYSGLSTGNYDLILVSPQLSNLPDGTHRLRFYASGYYNTLIQLGTLDSNSPTAVFTPYGAPTAITPEYAEYTVDFTQYTSSDTYIGVRFIPPFPQMDVFIDDVVWETAPSCPDVAGISVLEIDTANALATWDIGTQNSWQVSYAESTVTDPNNGTISNNTTDGSYQLSGLAPATTYNVWVRSVCTGDVKGNWIGPVEFITACTPASAFNEDFEDTTLLTVPRCWSTIRRGTGLSSSAYMITSSSEPYAGDQAFYIYGGSPVSNPATSDIILVSPPVDNLANHTNSLSFYLKGTANIVVGTLNDNTADAVFTPYDTTITGNSVYTKYTVNFNDYSGTDQYIGLRYNAASNALVGLDNIVWDASLSNGDFDNGNFTAYPNPVKDILNLSYKQTISNVSVYNLLGQKIIDKVVDANTATVNMASLSSGTYIVKVTANNYTKTLKVVKE